MTRLEMLQLLDEIVREARSRGSITLENLAFAVETVFMQELNEDLSS